MSDKYPAGLPRRYRRLWRKPWVRRARTSKRFHKWLGKHGYLSPHFTKKEAACKDGSMVPNNLIRNARKHAFNLERLRHRIGDRPVKINSWYRSPAHNKLVGGASQSKHLEALATDHTVQWVTSIRKAGVDFDREANIVFKNSGFGTYPGGARHVDSRPYRARWTSWVPGR